MLPETSYLPFYWQSLCRNLSSVGSKSRSENSYLKTSSVCLPYGKIAPTSRKSITSSRDTINLICQLQYEFLVQKSAPEFLSSKTTHPHVNDWLILLLTDRPSRPFEFQADRIVEVQFDENYWGNNMATVKINTRVQHVASGPKIFKCKEPGNGFLSYWSSS